MKILITGGLGNIGVTLLNACAEAGHEVSVFDIRNRKNEKLAKKYGRRLKAVFFGDIRNREHVTRAVSGQDVVVHMAAVLPPLSETSKALCSSVNVGGTGNLLDCIAEAAGNCRMVFISSVSVMGPTQDKNRLLAASDPPDPTDNYSLSKMQAERLVAGAGIDHCILRLAAVMPSRFGGYLHMAKLMFDIPPSARCEIIVDVDVATAILNASENLCRENSINKKVFFLGGGRRNGCQLLASEMIGGMFEQFGLKAPPPGYFNSNINGYYLDWYDTEESERQLRYQNHSFSDYKAVLTARYGYLKPLFRILSPLINQIVIRYSPYN